MQNSFKTSLIKSHFQGDCPYQEVFTCNMVLDFLRKSIILCQENSLNGLEKF